MKRMFPCFALMPAPKPQAAAQWFPMRHRYRRRLRLWLLRPASAGSSTSTGPSSAAKNSTWSFPPEKMAGPLDRLRQSTFTPRAQNAPLFSIDEAANLPTCSAHLVTSPRV